VTKNAKLVSFPNNTEEQSNLAPPPCYLAPTFGLFEKRHFCRWEEKQGDVNWIV